MIEAKARQVANEWGELHRERWTPTVEFSAERERVAWVAMRRHLEAFAPDDGFAAGALRVPDGPPVTAIGVERTVIVFRYAGVGEDDHAEIEARSVPLEGASLMVRSMLSQGRFGGVAHEAVWTLTAGGEEFSFATQSPEEEVLPRALAAALGWAMPDDQEAGRRHLAA